MPSRERLETLKRGSTMQLLLRCARLVNEQAIERVNREAGRSVFRQAIAALVPHIDHEGTRVGELARRVGVSKQAVSKVIAELEEQGVVETVPDPHDARARLVRFTAAGRKAIEHGLSILLAIEDELADGIGRGRMKELRETLLRLQEALERRG